MHLTLNNVTPATLNAYASARIIPLKKPNGKIRPIACGTALRRIVTAAVVRVIVPEVSNTLHPYQYAIGRAAGAEELHKLIQVLLDLDNEHALLSIDAQAALSEVDRAAKVHAVQTLHPDLEQLIRPWVHIPMQGFARQNYGLAHNARSTDGLPFGCSCI